MRAAHALEGGLLSRRLLVGPAPGTSAHVASSSSEHPCGLGSRWPWPAGKAAPPLLQGHGPCSQPREPRRTPVVGVSPAVGCLGLCCWPGRCDVRRCRGSGSWRASGSPRACCVSACRPAHPALGPAGGAVCVGGKANPHLAELGLRPVLAREGLSAPRLGRRKVPQQGFGALSGPHTGTLWLAEALRAGHGECGGIGGRTPRALPRGGRSALRGEGTSRTVTLASGGLVPLPRIPFWASGVATTHPL